MESGYVLALAGLALALPASAEDLPSAHGTAPAEPVHLVPPLTEAALSNSAQDQLSIFAPRGEPIRHTIDYDIWDYALKNMVLTMGPPNRKGSPRPNPTMGTRIVHGATSRYRLEGSMVLFNFLDRDVIESFTAYRADLEQVASKLDIASLPRNEQLAFWLNLHNVALMEQLTREWPVRQPRQMMIGGVPLDDAPVLTIRGIPLSLRDIRENIVYRHWKDPKVIYGFWRGEIGGPELQRHAFTGANVASLLDAAALDYVNSLRAVAQEGETMKVASLYAEVAPFYFRNLEPDLRSHLAKYAEEPVAEILRQTRVVDATIAEPDIADLHGGARPPGYFFAGAEAGAMGDPLIGWSTRLGQAGLELLQARARKLQTMARRGQPTGRVFFSNIALPGDPLNKNAVE